MPEELSRRTLLIDADLHKKIKIEAAKVDMSVKDYVGQVFDYWFKKSKERK